MTGQTKNRSKAGHGVLSANQIREIRAARVAYYENMPKNLCKKYGVSRSVISKIWQDCAYTHVGGLI